MLTSSLFFYPLWGLGALAPQPVGPLLTSVLKKRAMGVARPQDVVVWDNLSSHGGTIIRAFLLDELNQRAQEAVADVTRQQNPLIARVKHAGLSDALWPGRDQ